MNVFNMINGGGGSGSGLYIWKKYEYIPEQTLVNPTFTATVSKNDLAINFTDASFDLSQLPLYGYTGDYMPIKSGIGKTIGEFFEGFGGYFSTVYMYFFLGNDYLGVQGPSSVLGYAYSYEASAPKTAKMRGSYSVTYTNVEFSYEGTKTLPAKIGEFISYVVSEDSTKYPDGGEQGGYYYEKATPLAIENFGCTKYETGSLTVSSTTSYKTVSHSLGVIPKFAILYRSEPYTNYLDFAVVAFTNAGSSGGLAGTSCMTSQQSNSCTTSDASTTQANFSVNISSYFYFYGTYNYILLA